MILLLSSAAISSFESRLRFFPHFLFDNEGVTAGRWFGRFVSADAPRLFGRGDVIPTADTDARPAASVVAVVVVAAGVVAVVVDDASVVADAASVINDAADKLLLF
jgi:hypothetical protein